jgi:hypothetical protein
MRHREQEPTPITKGQQPVQSCPQCCLVAHPVHAGGMKQPTHTHVGSPTRCALASGTVLGTHCNPRDTPCGTKAMQQGECSGCLVDVLPAQLASTA